MSKFNVLILGAGRINFGSTEAHWNHSARLEKKLGSRLNVVGLIDINTAHAENILTMKRAADSIKAGYEHTKVFKTIDEAAEVLKGDDAPHKLQSSEAQHGTLTCNLVINGLQGYFRGTTLPGRDSDVKFAKLFPGSAQFIEKPISAGLADELEKVNEQLTGVTSVGYMLRYLKAVQEMKKIIEDNKLRVMATTATYLMAYEYAGSVVQNGKFAGYWDIDDELGPVVGQGTHIVDLSRYLAPPQVHGTLHVHTVESADPAGHLSKIKFDEDALLPPEKRIPRVTQAIWQWEGGATGSLLHGVALHEGDYDCELMVLADGWKLRLVDPYGHSPKLYVRRPGTSEEVRTVFADDDPYYSELSTIIDVVEGKLDKSAILSPYHDAMQTYNFTWQIRLAGEEAARKRGARP